MTRRLGCRVDDQMAQTLELRRVDIVKIHFSYAVDLFELCCLRLRLLVMLLLLLYETDIEKQRPSFGWLSLTVGNVLFSSHLVFAVSSVCVQVFHERVPILTTSLFPGVFIPQPHHTSPHSALFNAQLSPPTVHCLLPNVKYLLFTC